jgi:hypothetical protein
VGGGSFAPVGKPVKQTGPPPPPSPPSLLDLKPPTSFVTNSVFSYSDDFYGLIDDAFAVDWKARLMFAVLDHKVHRASPHPPPVTEACAA